MAFSPPSEKSPPKCDVAVHVPTAERLAVVRHASYPLRRVGPPLIAQGSGLARHDEELELSQRSQAARLSSIRAGPRALGLARVDNGRGGEKDRVPGCRSRGGGAQSESQRAIRSAGAAGGWVLHTAFVGRAGPRDGTGALRGAGGSGR